jgi:hypothetical protein
MIDIRQVAPLCGVCISETALARHSTRLLHITGNSTLIVRDHLYRGPASASENVESARKRIFFQMIFADPC